MKQCRMIGEPCTCCGDVVELASFEKDGSPLFSLCKILMLEDPLRSDEKHWIYALIVSGDTYPIIVSPIYAKSISENPDHAFELVFNRHLDRYR